MGILNSDLDITKNIKIIEWLKSRLLTDTAELFANMAEINPDDSKERLDILADLVLITYLLSARLGISGSALDLRVGNRLRVALLDEDETQEWRQELSDLVKHFKER